jgi:UDP-N-acetylmuramate dehydrogenase
MLAAKKASELRSNFSGKTRENFPIKRLTTFKVGGLADVVLEADTNEKLIEALGLIRKLKLNYFVIAGGSNLVFADKGFRGVVVHYTAEKIRLLANRGSSTVMVDAGCSLGKLVRYSAAKNLGGFDFLANIPGSVGGGVVGNAGCYGKSIGEYVVAVKVFDMKNGKEKVLAPKQLKFSYRNSLCKTKPEWIVMEVELKIVPVKKLVVLKAIEAERMERWRKHPHQPSAGSFFKNIDGQPTWKLIDGVGLRGKRIGGARVSAKHPNFLVNIGGAKAGDVSALMKVVQKAVQREYHLRLEPEVRMVNELGVVK